MDGASWEAARGYLLGGSQFVRNKPHSGATFARGALGRFLGPLRRRFSLLLLLLGALSVAPWYISLGAHSRLTGLARQIDLAGSLRYRLLALEVSLAEPDSTDPSDLMGQQMVTLSVLIDGDPAREVPRCQAGPACDRLREHLDRWERRIAPTVQSALVDIGNDGRTAAVALIRRELGEVETTVHLLADAREAEIDDVVRGALAIGAGSLLLVLLIGYGIWDAFARIRRLEDATRGAEAEAKLEVQAAGYDEVASLARSLGANLRELRLRNEDDARRVDRLHEQQRVLGEVVEALNGWIAGTGSLDAALAKAAPAAGFRSAWVEGRLAGSARTLLGTYQLDRAPRDGDGAVTTELGFGERRIGALAMAAPAGPPMSEETRRLYEILGHAVALAVFARGLLDEREQRSRIAALLATVGSLEDGVAQLGAILRLSIDHDVTYVMESSAGQTWRVAPDGVTRLAGPLMASVPDDIAVQDAAQAALSCPPVAAEKPTSLLVVPLREDGRLLAALVLCRRRDVFGPDDIDAARRLEPLLAAAIARMDLEARLRTTEQLAVLGGLGRMLAHEVRNPLNSLALHLTLLDRGLGKAHVPAEHAGALRDHIGVLRGEVARLDELVQRFLDLSSADATARFTTTDLRHLLEQVLAVHAPTMAELDVKLDADLGPAPAPVRVDAHRIQQVMHNLVQNAIEAMAGQPERKLTVRLAAANGGWEVHVADTGPGIKEPGRIFSGTYTTKPAGNGIGLAVSLQIARLHQGNLVARSNGVGGAEFVLTLQRELEAPAVVVVEPARG